VLEGGAGVAFKHTFYPESRFGGFTHVDGTIAFYTRVNALLEESFSVLDFGCGRGEYRDDTVAIRRELRILKGKVSRVIGIDADEAAGSNPFLDEFHLIGPSSTRWPLDAASVDMCICDQVMEHIERPEDFFSECRRILRPGGYLCIRTPNSRSYAALISRIVPDRLHARILARVQSDRKEEDVFPTYYRCNTIPTLRLMLGRHGFDHAVYGVESEPSYLSFSKLAYALGVFHQRHAPRFLRMGILAFARLRDRGTE
jgi:SAM-dependent methyltransferase